MLAVGVVRLLLLIPLAHEHTNAGPSDTTLLTPLARVAQAGNHYSYEIAMITLGLGSLMFCRVLYQARLVPRVIAV